MGRLMKVQSTSVDVFKAGGTSPPREDSAYPTAPPGSSLDLVFKALSANGADYDGTSFTCPVHDDHSPSLSVSVGETRPVLVVCHPCAAEMDPAEYAKALCSELGIDLSVLSIEQNPKNPSQVNAKGRSASSKRSRHATSSVVLDDMHVVDGYEYQDEHGSPLRRVERWEDQSSGKKTFRQSHWDGSSWSRGVPATVRSTPYQLEQFAAAKVGGRPFYLVEGEKDVHSLEEAGEFATTFAGGAAGRLDDDWPQYFEGVREVRIVADRDEAGYARALTYYEGLSAAAIPCRILLSASKEPKSDVSDHLAAGFSVDELVERNADRVRRQLNKLRAEKSGLELTHGEDKDVAAVDEAAYVAEKFRRLDWFELFEGDDTTEWVIEPLLPKGRLIALYSAPKVGKSLLMLDVAAGLASGRSVLGNEPKPSVRVLYVDFENDPRGDVRARLAAMGYGPEDLAHLDYLSFPNLEALDSRHGGEELLRAVRFYESEVVIIDTVSRTINGEENENDTWLKVYQHTCRPLKQAGVSVIRLDHSGKNEAKGMRGGSAKSGDVDAVWRLSPISGSDDTLRLECEMSRFLMPEKHFTIAREEDPLRHRLVRSQDGSSVSTLKIREVVEALDKNEVPTDLARNDLRTVMSNLGIHASNDLLGAVMKQRRLAESANCEGPRKNSEPHS